MDIQGKDAEGDQEGRRNMMHEEGFLKASKG